MKSDGWLFFLLISYFTDLTAHIMVRVLYQMCPAACLEKSPNFHYCCNKKANWPNTTALTHFCQSFNNPHFLRDLRRDEAAGVDSLHDRPLPRGVTLRLDGRDLLLPWRWHDVGVGTLEQWTVSLWILQTLLLLDAEVL